MTAKEIIEKCSSLAVEEQRSVSDGYIELVFFTKDADAWTKALGEVLGPAVKAAGVEPTEDDLNSTEDYGGIHGNQTLFKKDFADTCAIAMFWPWSDGIHTTLKAALLKK
jgi:hypothetical protein